MRILKNLLIIVGLGASLFGQVPQGVTGLMDERSGPELKVLVYWQPVTGASGYKIYEFGQVGFTCPTADSAYTYDTTVTEPWYGDDPNPGWWQVDPNNRGAWQRRWWCYEVTAVVNGVESGRSQPARVGIGTAGYVTMRFQSSCADPVTVLTFPYTFAQMDVHLYFKDLAGVVHEIPYLTNATTYADEVEWKLPAIGKDGTIVPVLNSGGKYYYTWKTPDMAFAIQSIFLPAFQPDQVVYSQIRINRVQGVGDCQVLWEQSGGSYINTQNVTR